VYFGGIDFHDKVGIDSPSARDQPIRFLLELFQVLALLQARRIA
jgi:hypothetical protein